MSRHNVTVTFTLKDGRKLRCEYSYWYDQGGYWAPPECDVGAPTYLLEDEEISVEELPRGLASIADAMYEYGDADVRFKYESELDQGDDDGWFDLAYDERYS